MGNGNISIPIVNNEYRVIVVWGDPKYIDKIAREWGYPKGDVYLREKNRGQCCYNANCHPFILLRKYPTTDEEIGTLAHEACHAVTNIFDKVEANWDGEFFAHSVGAVVREVLKRRKK